MAPTPAPGPGKGLDDAVQRYIFRRLLQMIPIALGISVLMFSLLTLAPGDPVDLLIASDGKIAAVIVGVGGFLGMGEKDVALPFDQLMFAKDASDDLIVSTSATKESLQSAPEYTKPEDRS